MIDNEAVRKFALSLPETEEQDHRGRPSFRVQGKIYATLWEADKRAVLKLQLADQSALTAAHPDIFFLTGWEHQGWTGVELAKVDADMFRDLMVNAWRNVAPGRLTADYDK